MVEFTHDSIKFLDDRVIKLPEADKVVSILSGGMDSSIMTILLVKYYGAENVYPISFDYNQKQVVEVDRAKALCKEIKTAEHKTFDLSVLGEIAKPMCANIAGTDVEMPTIKDVLGDPQPVTYVPFRNMILLTLAMSYAETIDSNDVFTGLQVHDEYGYWDTTGPFVDSLNAVANQNRTHRVAIRAPFLQLSKIDELKICEGMDAISLLKHSLTCYNPKDGKSCGKCPSCSERINSFMKLNLVDPIDYQVEIPWRQMAFDWSNV
jgi:7-cyano-7-deazaguanine synthase